MRDAFHHAAVTEERVAVVIDNLETVAVELGGQQLLGQCESNGIAETLAQRAGGRFDAGGMTVFRVAGRLAVQLAEFFQFVERQIVTRQVQQRVDQHRAVAIGEHETVTVGPFRVGRVVFEMTIPQGDGHFGHAHRCAGVSGVCCLNTIHGQNANCVSQRSLRSLRSLRSHLSTPDALKNHGKRALQTVFVQRERRALLTGAD